MRNTLSFALCAAVAAMAALAFAAEGPQGGIDGTSPGLAAPAETSPSSQDPRAQQPGDKTPPPFPDEPEAHAIYDGMIQAFRDAKSIYCEGDYVFGTAANRWTPVKYRMWLAKPNYVRFEALRGGKVTGVLVGDGRTFWTYWPAGRPEWYSKEHDGKDDEYKAARFTSYMRKGVGVGMHSISHDVGNLGAGIGMLVLDPSTFHGYTDSMQEFLDGVRALGPEKMGGEECDLIEVSFMKGQRRWFLWVARSDRLPRKQKEHIYVHDLLVKTDVWSNMEVNGAVSEEMFAWQPGEGWTQYVEPPYVRELLEPGTAAPDFDLALIDGGRVKLSDYRGKVVWLFIWRAG